MTEEQLQWAMTQQWFAGARKPRGADYWIIETCDRSHFDNFSELRAWAGY